MADIAPDPVPGLLGRLRVRRDALVATPAFQAWAARMPLVRRLVRRDGARLFDLVAGFAYSQILHAVVTTDLPDRLAAGPKSPRALALEVGMEPEAMDILCRGAAALDLLQYQRDGRVRLARLGAALRGVPGLMDMIRHHEILYRDLAQPEAFLRGQTEPELAKFWPYVFGAGAATDPAQTARYSRLMADTQTLVAAETLAAVDLSKFRVLMDVGGGTGAFLAAALAAAPHLRGVLVDLPSVVGDVSLPRLTVAPADFRDDPLPRGADAVSLVRVLYDHRDDTVAALLAKVFDVLPAGGRVLVSEPMSGGARPSRSGDAYFALYCRAMRTGRVRAPETIGRLLERAGFTAIAVPRMSRPFVTQVVTARKPG